MYHRAFTRQRVAALCGAAALTIGVAACGSSDDSSTGTSAASTGAAAASTSASTTAASSDPIIIGHAGSTTSYMKTFDDQVAVGMKLAADQLNAKGGVDGRKIQIISSDSGSDQAKSRTAAQKLLEQGAQFIVPSCDYDVGGPAAQAASQKGVLSIGCAGGPLFGKTGLGPLVFNTYEGSPTTGAVSADFAIEKGWKTAYLIRDDSLAYTTDLCNNFQKAYEAQGGKVLGLSTMQNADTSFSAQVSKIQSAKPQVVVLCSYPTGGVTALRAIRSAGIDGPVIGTGSYDGDYWVKSVPGVSDFYIATVASRLGDNADATQNAFFADVKKSTGAEATSALYVMSGYESVESIAKGIALAGGKTDGSDVAKGLETFKDEPLLMGKTTYTTDCHIPIGRTESIMEYVDGKQKLLKTMAPKDVPEKTC
jgi:branched-chain amino acid transport system substrate-binding protein